MIPKHIRNEVLRRIPTAGDVTLELATALEIDPTAQPYEPVEPLVHNAHSTIKGVEGVVYCHVPFELTVTTLGVTTLVECRAAYAFKLGSEPWQSVDDMYDFQMRLEVLDWSDELFRVTETGEPCRVSVPRWCPADLFLLIPHALNELLDEQARTIAFERFNSGTQKSRP